MTVYISEAIEGLKIIREGKTTMPETKWIACCNLGIEALTLVRLLQAAPGNLSIPLLKGQTEK